MELGPYSFHRTGDKLHHFSKLSQKGPIETRTELLHDQEGVVDSNNFWWRQNASKNIKLNT